MHLGSSHFKFSWVNLCISQCYVHGWCSYEDVLNSGTMHHQSVSMEIVRRGALILFCDYVVCTHYALHCC